MYHLMKMLMVSINWKQRSGQEFSVDSESLGALKGGQNTSVGNRFTEPRFLPYWFVSDFVLSVCMLSLSFISASRPSVCLHF